MTAACPAALRADELPDAVAVLLEVLPVLPGVELLRGSRSRRTRSRSAGSARARGRARRRSCRAAARVGRGARAASRRTEARGAKAGSCRSPVAPMCCQEWCCRCSHPSARPLPHVVPRIQPDPVRRSVDTGLRTNRSPQSPTTMRSPTCRWRQSRSIRLHRRKYFPTFLTAMRSPGRSHWCPLASRIR